MPNVSLLVRKLDERANRDPAAFRAKHFQFGGISAVGAAGRKATLRSVHTATIGRIKEGEYRELQLGSLAHKCAVGLHALNVELLLVDEAGLLGVDGLRALVLWGGLQGDLIHAAQTEEERQAADDLLSLLTPVIKGYGTDKGYEIATISQQVYGGHGYIAEWGMEQYVRDARIAMIYEGTNGIQALDLVGRKLAQNGGRAIQLLFATLATEIAAAKAVPELADFATRLEKATGDLQASTMWLMQNGLTNPDNAGAASVPYMHLMGIVAVGLMWLRMASAAQALLAAGEGDAAFLTAKLTTARFYAERIMPDTGSLRRKLEAVAESMMSMPVEMFAA